MKNLALTLALLFTGIIATAQEKTEATVTVTIENVLSDEGTILASLHTSETFMKGPGFINTAATAKEGEVTLIFENVLPGTFAFMVMHDANNNKRMDMEPNGMPKENYVTSGGLELFGPPTFEGSKFEVDGKDLEFRIRF